MPIQLNQAPPIGLGGVYRRLDYKTGRLPQLEEQIVPVVIYADLSTTIASEVLEARAVMFQGINGAPGLFGVIELQCLSAGGLVVESLTYFQPTATAVLDLAAFTIGPLPGSIGAALPGPSRADVGGEPTVSSVRSSREAVFNPNGSDTSGFAITINAVNILPTRIYVPPGFFFALWSANATAFSASIVWRELSEIQGGAS